jgi:PhnB protein
MQLNPYLLFHSQCEAAFAFYAQVLGGKITFKMTVAESPMAKEAPPERLGEILHIRLVSDGITLMGGDCPPEYYVKPQGFSVSLNVDSAEAAERIFKALSEKGAVSMPIQETFWAVRFGMCTDQFGTPWMINCEKPM